MQKTPMRLKMRLGETNGTHSYTNGCNVGNRNAVWSRVWYHFG